MIKNIVAVVVGYVLWTALWLGGNALFFSELAEQAAAGTPITSTAPLLGVLVLSIVCSLAAGVAAGAISRRPGPVLITGMALLITGIFVQAGAWTLMPVWYHLVFLALIVPVVLVGGRLPNRTATESLS